jgi:mannose-6-phosphate isomerase-like protein (cupin superfamily)
MPRETNPHSSPSARAVVTGNLAEKFASFADKWCPKIIGQVNGVHIKLAKLEGEFEWHQHDHEDELFLVVKGTLRMRLGDREVAVNEGEFIIIPAGTAHLPIADQETHVLLVEPAGTVNTGANQTDRTVTDIEWI